MLNNYPRRAHFAPVAPPGVLLALKNEGVLGDYHLLLAHEVAPNADLYCNLMEGSKKTIIMDNSAFELGKPATAAVMGKAIRPLREMGHTVIAALPDLIGNKDGTIAALKQHFEEWNDHGLAPFMMIPQGETLSEWISCFYELETFLTPHMDKTGSPVHVGIPRYLGNKVGTRASALAFLTEKVQQPAYKVHLLGFSNKTNDDIMCARHPAVVGIDSSEPVRAGLEGKAWDLKNPPTLETRRDDYWKLGAKVINGAENGRFLDLVVANIKTIRNAVAQPLDSTQ